MTCCKENDISEHDLDAPLIATQAIGPEPRVDLLTTEHVDGEHAPGVLLQIDERAVVIRGMQSRQSCWRRGGPRSIAAIRGGARLV